MGGDAHGHPLSRSCEDDGQDHSTALAVRDENLGIVETVFPIVGLLVGQAHILAGLVVETGDDERSRHHLHDAPFLLLDEPTSNLDSLNEGIILKAVRDECREKTVLLVSHRKSTMAVADVSFSVESGRLS